GRVAGESQPAHAAPQLRYAPARRRGGFANGARTARPCQHPHDAALHARRPRPAEGDPPAIPPPGTKPAEPGMSRSETQNTECRTSPGISTFCVGELLAHELLERYRIELRLSGVVPLPGIAAVFGDHFLSVAEQQLLGLKRLDQQLAAGELGPVDA